MGSNVQNPLFARLFDRFAAKDKGRGEDRLRDELVAGLEGRVVEVGPGNGINFKHFPATVEELVAVEPEPYLRSAAERTAASVPVQVRVVDGTAEDLPLDGRLGRRGGRRRRALLGARRRGRPRRVRRVLREGGELRFYEHVRSGRPGFARYQDAVDRVWPRLMGGCHPNRDTLAAIRGAGFEVERVRAFGFPAHARAYRPAEVLGPPEPRGRRVRRVRRAATVAGMDLDVVFLGTGGSVPTARRATACLLVRAGGERLLFDCGEGAQRQMQRSTGLVQVDEIYLTHYHADHYLGLPGLLKTYDLNDREAPLRVLGPPGLRGLFEALQRITGRVRYPLELVEIRADDPIPHGTYEIRPFAVEHRVRAYGYAFVEDERPGRFDPEEAKRLGVAAGPDFARLQAGETVEGSAGPVEPGQVLGEPRSGRKLVIAGDTAPCEMTRIAAHEAELSCTRRASPTRSSRERGRPPIPPPARPRGLPARRR